MKYLLLIGFTIFFSADMVAQWDRLEYIWPDSTKNVFSQISEKNFPESGEVKFYQDKRIEKLVIENISTRGALVQGYRVQVFSSNAHRTAREEAFKVERMLQETFPDMGIYVSYSSPFWKVRIGDFHTQQEAREFAEELLKEFPSLKKATYTVRDRISISER